MKTPEEQIQKIIDDADAAFKKQNYSYSGNYKLYLKENQRCEFLKVHLKMALETIEHMKGLEGAAEQFYIKALELAKPK